MTKCTRKKDRKNERENKFIENVEEEKKEREKNYRECKGVKKKRKKIIENVKE